MDASDGSDTQPSTDAAEQLIVALAVRVLMARRAQRVGPSADKEGTGNGRKWTWQGK